ncbi:MAG: acyl-CoA dehydrogenase C-terminal domain-containing protein [Saprospiraceae bacterium]
MQKASQYNELKPYAHELENYTALTQNVLEHLIPFAMRGEHERFLADANIFMELFSNLVIGWQWLKM